MPECFLGCHSQPFRLNTEVIVLRREGREGAMMIIADMTGVLTGRGLTEDAGNVKKEDGYGVQRRGVGFVALNVFVTSDGMTGIEDIEK